MSNQSFPETTMQLLVEQLLIDDEHWGNNCASVFKIWNCQGIAKDQSPGTIESAKVLLQQAFADLTAGNTHIVASVLCQFREVSNGQPPVPNDKSLME